MNNKIALFSPFPLSFLAELGFKGIYIPFLLQRHLIDYERILTEGELLGFDLNSPLIAQISVPLMKREKINRAIVTIPLDIREIITAMELSNNDFFPFDLTKKEESISKLKRWLGKSAEVTPDKPPPRSNNDFFIMLNKLFYLFSNKEVRFDGESCNGPPIGILGDLPPVVSFYETLCKNFRIIWSEYIEYFQLDMKSFSMWVASPVEKINFLDKKCRKLKLAGFLFFNYSFSSWQNYEIIYEKNLSCPILPIEIKDGRGFTEREILRLEAFKNKLEGG